MGEHSQELLSAFARNCSECQCLCRDRQEKTASEDEDKEETHTEEIAVQPRVKKRKWFTEEEEIKKYFTLTTRRGAPANAAIYSQTNAPVQ